MAQLLKCLLCKHENLSLIDHLLQLSALVLTFDDFGDFLDSKYVYMTLESPCSCSFR